MCQEFHRAQPWSGQGMGPVCDMRLYMICHMCVCCSVVEHTAISVEQYPVSANKDAPARLQQTYLRNDVQTLQYISRCICCLLQPLLPDVCPVSVK